MPRRYVLRVGTGESPSGGSLAPSITTTSLPNATEGEAYSQTLAFELDGGTLATPGLTVTVGSLPAGLSLNSQTGVISGTPTNDADETFTVQIELASGETATRELTIVVDAAAGVTPWFEEDFESYANTTALRAAYTDISDSPNEVVLATGLTGLPNGGSKALRRQWNTTTTTLESGMSIEFPDAAVDQPTEVWIELYTNMANHSRSANGDKVLFLQDEDFNRWDLMQNTGSTIICTAGTAGVVNDGDPNETVRWKTAHPNGSVINFVDDFIGVDAWTQLRFYCRMGRGTANGALIVWRDGTKVFENNDPLATNEPGDYFRYLQIGANSAANSGASQDFTDVTVYTSDPGW